MFYDDNEIDNAVKTLDEGQGEFIEDSHEEENKYPSDENDLISGNGTSYKQEARYCKSSFDEKIKELKNKRKEEIAALSSNDPSEVDKINQKYDALEKEAQEE